MICGIENLETQLHFFSTEWASLSYIFGQIVHSLITDHNYMGLSLNGLFCSIHSCSWACSIQFFFLVGLCTLFSIWLSESALLFLKIHFILQVLYFSTHILEYTWPLWPPAVKNWLIGKDPDAGKDWRQEEKETTETVVWHHRLNGCEFEQTPGDSEGQGSLACCSPWGHKGSDIAELLNWTKLSSSNSS